MVRPTRTAANRKEVNVMLLRTALSIALVAAIASPALALETAAYQLKEDFGVEVLYDNAIQYYYYVPCPTYSWFWAYSGWDRDEVIGCWFQVGDLSTGGWEPGDPLNCHVIEQLRILDFAGYGTVRGGLFTVEFEIYCSDQYGCPIGPPIWNSGPYETHFAWNYIPVDPPLTICDCAVSPGPPPSGPRILVTATHTGPEGIYPSWGFDNISTPLEQGCALHDYGCLPALYPRPYVSHWPTMHSGFYGVDFRYCPPQGFTDGRDTTPDGSQFGFIELAWRIYLVCSGPTQVQPTSWGNIKSMYR
jgi:hypothetical protein